LSTNGKNSYKNIRGKGRMDIEGDDFNAENENESYSGIFDNASFSLSGFARRLWGDWFYNGNTHKFQRSPIPGFFLFFFFIFFFIRWQAKV
jgi:hypothetical protein